MTTTDLLTAYLACWNETDPDERHVLIERHWAPDASYVDPMVEVTGVDAIVDVIAAVQQQFAGYVFTAVSGPDGHHDLARFQWGLGPADGDPVVVGFDVVRTDRSGRIGTVLGFLDLIPT